MNIFVTSQNLDLSLFQNPTAAYRGAPFWSWNTKLNRDQLLRQIDVLKQMGMGGFHIHVRTGLQTEYLGTEFMAHVQACVDYAQQQGLLAWLYDEDRWPSGAGGGRVTQNTEYRAKHLLFTARPYDGENGQPILISTAQATRLGNGVLLARYAVTLDNGILAAYRRLTDNDTAQAHETVWYAYLETALPSPWFNNQTYVDTLNKRAVERFIEVTHEVYKRAVGQHFGTTIPAMFTDEPQFPHKGYLAYSDVPQDVVLPFTTDFFDTYDAAYSQRLEDHLPEIFWELPQGQPSQVRYRYHDHLAERFSSAYADTLGAWCRNNGLALTGHMMEEPTLQSQAAALGEAMRSYRAFELPGIDMLCDWHEYNTAKQAQSAAHQYGRVGTMSEIYGVTNWDFDFAGHKAAGDWQAALGVVLRVHHLSWVSMEGEAKRDYPASISYQSPWYKEYPLIEDHFARVNTLLTRGKANVRVGMIHPIESYWLCFGPLDHTSRERQQRDQTFKDLTEWLLFGLVDFDFIAESLLPSLHEEQNSDGNKFQVGQAAYDVVLVPPMRTMRRTTVEQLAQFHAQGGTIIFTGEVPSLMDAVPSDRVQSLARQCQHVVFAPFALLASLEHIRDIAITHSNGTAADSILYQWRDDNDKAIVFLCNTDKRFPRHNTRIRLRGHWQITRMDTFTGGQQPLQAVVEKGWTSFLHDFEACGSLLMSLEAASQSIGQAYESVELIESGRLSASTHITLSEPNVLVLDRAAVKLDDGNWQVPEEILRLDNRLRQRLNYPLRMEAWAQPWTEPVRPTPEHRVQLRYEIHSNIDLNEAKLALENANITAIWLDGQRVDAMLQGYFVDESIQTVALPSLNKGDHTLLLDVPYDKHISLEACYLLGDFGVEVRGWQANLIAPVHQLAFGDWTRQGLPFYAGNVTYHCDLNSEDESVVLHIPKFHAPLIAVRVNGQDVAPVALPPYQVRIPLVKGQTNKLELMVYGSRINTFGTLHNANENTVWYGPMAWRTEGQDWSDEYILTPCGIFVAPRLLQTKQ